MSTLACFFFKVVVDFVGFEIPPQKKRCCVTQKVCFPDAKDGSQTWLGRLVVALELSGRKTDGLLKRKRRQDEAPDSPERSLKKCENQKMCSTILLGTSLVGSSWRVWRSDFFCVDETLVPGVQDRLQHYWRKLNDTYLYFGWENNRWRREEPTPLLLHL